LLLSWAWRYIRPAVEPAIGAKAMSMPESMDCIYKFRAETREDVERLQELLDMSRVERIDVQSIVLQNGAWIPDVVVTITAPAMTLDDLRQAMARVPDGHVMWQTVQPAAKYDGERTCDDEANDDPEPSYGFAFR